jgi:hypothetical protein
VAPVCERNPVAHRKRLRAARFREPGRFQFNDAWEASLVGARHISSPLGARQRLAEHRLAGRLSKARNAAAEQKDLWGLDITPKALNPASGRSAVLGRNALDQPGDCNAARQTSFGVSKYKNQEIRGEQLMSAADPSGHWSLGAMRYQ